MKNFFRLAAGAIMSVFATTPKNYNGKLIPTNEPPKRLKSEVLPESIAASRRMERDAQRQRAIELQIRRYGLQRFTDGVNTVMARDEKNGMRKLRNMANA